MSVQDPYISSVTQTQNGLAVTVIGTNTSTGELMVRDSFGNEFKTDGNIRLKGTGFPMPGETWIISKLGNTWVPEAQIGAPQISTIRGSREGLPPIMEQVLDALARQGLVLDQTTTPPVIEVPDPTTDDPPDPDDPDAPDEEDPPSDHDPAEDPDPGQVPPDDNGPTDPDPEPDPPSPVPTPAEPSGALKNLYLGSYNTLKDLGPRTAYNDLVRLTKTKMQICGLQEAHKNERDGGFRLLKENHGWNYYRPKTSGFVDENTIIWKDDDFTLLDKGSMYLDHYSTDGHRMPPRYLVWVKLTHKASHRVIFFMDTHLDPHLEHGGHPYWNLAWDVPRIRANINMIDKIAKKMKAFGVTGPVFTAGDWNIDHFGDHRVRYSGYPTARFGRENTYSNWGTLARHPHIGTSGGRYIDQIFGTRLGAHHVTHVDHWVLTGYKSDHRPMMARYRIRST